MAGTIVRRRTMVEVDGFEPTSTFLPAWADSGQLVWYAERHGAVIGRSEVRDDAAGVASGFSCEPICCGVVRDNVYMDPGSVADVVGNEGDPFSPKETRRDCYGNLFGPYDMTSQSEWESSDPSVATVSGGHVTCVSGGMAGITATFNSITAFSSYPSMCYAIVVPGTAGGSMTVNEPTLERPSSVTRGGTGMFTIQNTNANAQISGWKFSSSVGTVNRMSGTSSTSWSGVILDAKDVEPCGGFVNRNHGGNCEKLGSINFPPYQACQ